MSKVLTKRFVREQDVCVFSVTHTHTYFFDDEVKGHVCFYISWIPKFFRHSGMIEAKKEIRRERKETGGRISQLNISGTFPSPSPPSV